CCPLLQRELLLARQKVRPAEISSDLSSRRHVLASDQTQRTCEILLRLTRHTAVVQQPCTCTQSFLLGVGVASEVMLEHARDEPLGLAIAAETQLRPRGTAQSPHVGPVQRKRFPEQTSRL